LRARAREILSMPHTMLPREDLRKGKNTLWEGKLYRKDLGKRREGTEKKGRIGEYQPRRNLDAVKEESCRVGGRDRNNTGNQRRRKRQKK